MSFDSEQNRGGETVGQREKRVQSGVERNSKKQRKDEKQSDESNRYKF